MNRAFKVGKKNFLFLGEKPDGSIRIMLKLDGSAQAAKDLMDPRVVVGKTGWVTIVFDPDDPVDVSRLEAWVRESFETFASKRVLKQLE